MKNLLRSAFNFFLFNGIFISSVAVAMSFHTCQFILGIYLHLPFLLFLFFGTLLTYNFYWYFYPNQLAISQRQRWSLRYRKLHLLLSVISGVFCCVLFFKFKLPFPWIAVALSIMYFAPKLHFASFSFFKKISSLKTILLTLIWMYVTSVFPLQMYTHDLSVLEWKYCWQNFFLIFSVCLLFDYKDKDTDRKHGCKNTVDYLSPKWFNILYYGSIFLYFLFSISLYPAKTWLEIVSSFSAGIILLMLFRYCLKNTSDYFYFLFLDGLLALPSVLYFLMHI